MIEIKECSKSFGTLLAVNDVSLDIGEREVFGLIGITVQEKVRFFEWQQEF